MVFLPLTSLNWAISHRKAPLGLECGSRNANCVMSRPRFLSHRCPSVPQEHPPPSLCDGKSDDENPVCHRQSRFSEFKHFHDKVNAGTWLKPGAWGCGTKGRSDPTRRGFRPTALANTSKTLCLGVHGSESRAEFFCCVGTRPLRKTVFSPSQKSGSASS
jgi:hypothetical protein